MATGSAPEYFSTSGMECVMPRSAFSTVKEEPIDLSGDSTEAMQCNALEWFSTEFPRLQSENERLKQDLKLKDATIETLQHQIQLMLESNIDSIKTHARTVLELVLSHRATESAKQRDRKRTAECIEQIESLKRMRL